MPNIVLNVNTEGTNPISAMVSAGLTEDGIQYVAEFSVARFTWKRGTFSSFRVAEAFISYAMRDFSLALQGGEKYALVSANGSFEGTWVVYEDVEATCKKLLKDMSIGDRDYHLRFPNEDEFRSTWTWFRVHPAINMIRVF